MLLGLLALCRLALCPLLWSVVFMWQLAAAHMDRLLRLVWYKRQPLCCCCVVCRCATYQSSDGKWNKFGGRLAWDNTAICNNNPAWNGRGAHKTGDDYPAAPNIDHTQVFMPVVFGHYDWI
jgi:hypothetical protein